MRAALCMIVCLAVLPACRHDGKVLEDLGVDDRDMTATFTGFDLGDSDGGDELTNGALVVAPATLAFGHVTFGSSATASVHLANIGSNELVVNGAIVSGAGFSVDTSTLPLAIPSEGTATLAVTFAPTTHSDATGSLAIASTASSTPTVVSLTGNSSWQVDLTWDAPDMMSDAVVGYNVYRGTTSGGPYPTKVNTTLVPTTSYVDTTVQACMDYFYVTTSVDAQGNESGYSNQFEVDIPCS